MRPDFDTLSDDQIMALDQRDVDAYITLECISMGVPLPVDATLDPKPVKPEGAADTTLYVVGDFRFTNTEAAEAVAAAVREHQADRRGSKYQSGAGYQRIVTVPTDDVEVTTERIWSEANWAKHGGALEQYEEDIKAWRERESERTNSDEARQACVDTIQGRVDDVRRAFRLRERWKMELDRYIAAGLDSHAARTALLLANPSAAPYLPTYETLPLLDGDTPDASIATATNGPEGA